MEEDQMEESYTAEQFSLPAYGTHGWSRVENLAFSINHIEFDIPNYQDEVNKAKWEGRQELLDELRSLGAEAMIEKMEEIYYNDIYD
jgi:hypothetical protein